MAHTVCWIQYTKNNRSRKKIGDKDEKGLCKLMNNAVCEKAIENLRNRIDANRKQQKRLLKWTS